MTKIVDYNKVIENIRTNLRSYIVKNKMKSLVIGMSGGIDSTACAMLARPVCDLLGIPLIGRSIPILTNTDDEINLAKIIGEGVCNDFAEIDLSVLYQEMVRHIIGDLKDPTALDKLRCANFKVRIRMIKLYEMAQATGGMVLSTDNFTEYLTGFWTKHGDVGDYGAIQKLWKLEVYRLVAAMLEYDIHFYGERNMIPVKEAIKRCIKSIPTDGLGLSKSDVEQLGAKDYAEVEAVLKDFLTGAHNIDNVHSHPVISRHLASEHKRNDPYNIERSELLRAAI